MEIEQPTQNKSSRKRGHNDISGFFPEQVSEDTISNTYHRTNALFAGHTVMSSNYKFTDEDIKLMYKIKPVRLVDNNFVLMEHHNNISRQYPESIFDVRVRDYSSFGAVIGDVSSIKGHDGFIRTVDFYGNTYVEVGRLFFKTDKEAGHLDNTSPKISDIYLHIPKSIMTLNVVYVQVLLNFTTDFPGYACMIYIPMTHT